MSTYKRLLVAVDLAAAADAVMKTTVELGRALQAELHQCYSVLSLGVRHAVNTSM